MFDHGQAAAFGQQKVRNGKAIGAVAAGVAAGVIDLDRMGGLVHSQRVLLALTQAGVTRDDAYRLVQRNAMQVWQSDGQLSLLELLKADPEVSAVMSAQELEDKFNLDYHFKAVDTIFARVFGE